MSTEKKNSSQGAVKVKDSETAQKKVEKREEGAAKLAAPTLPGSMKYMLNDEKDEDKDLVFIQVTFYRKNVQDLVFGVRSEEGIQELSPLEYDNHKESRRRLNKDRNEAEAAVGWAKSLGRRCLIFVPETEGMGELFKLKSVPPPPIVKSVMGKSQKEFRLDFPTEDKVLEFWLGQKAETIEAIVTYAEKLGANYRENVRKLYDLKLERDSKKAKKAEEALKHQKNPDPAKKKGEPPTKSEKTENQVKPKGKAWIDMIEDDEKKQKKQAQFAAPPVTLDRAVKALMLFVSKEELSTSQSNENLSRAAGEIGFQLALEGKKRLDSFYEGLDHKDQSIIDANYAESAILENCKKHAIAAAAALGISFN